MVFCQNKRFTANHKELVIQFWPFRLIITCYNPFNASHFLLIRLKTHSDLMVNLWMSKNIEEAYMFGLLLSVRDIMKQRLHSTVRTTTAFIKWIITQNWSWRDTDKKTQTATETEKGSDYKKDRNLRYLSIHITYSRVSKSNNW